MGLDHRIIQQCYEVTQLRFRQLAAQQEHNYAESMRLFEAERLHSETCHTCRELKGYWEEYDKWVQEAG